MNFRPYSDWILVKYDPPQKRSDIIELAGDENSSVRTGTVVATGPGKQMDLVRAPMEVKPGEKVAFLRWHEEHRPGKAIAKTLRSVKEDVGDNVMLIRLSDILFVYEGELRVDTV